MSNSILSSLQEFIAKSPLFDGKTLFVNYLGKNVSLSIEDVPTETIVKRYTDGGSLRQALFLIASKEMYSRSIIENLRASGFYEQLSDWFEEQTFFGNLPCLPNGLKAQKIEAITNGYCMSADIEQQEQFYQVQCRMTYLKEAL